MGVVNGCSIAPGRTQQPSENRRNHPTRRQSQGLSPSLAAPVRFLTPLKGDSMEPCPSAPDGEGF